MKGNLLLRGMSLTGPENPPEVGHHLWAARKAMERGTQTAACGPPCWGWCFGGTRSGKPQMRMEEKLGPCCLPWCPELGHGRRRGTWGRSSLQQCPWWLWGPARLQLPRELLWGAGQCLHAWVLSCTGHPREGRGSTGHVPSSTMQPA